MQQTSKIIHCKGFLFDIIIYLTVMFLIREVYFSQLPFIANGLLWSFSTFTIVIWRMKVRRITWKDIGFQKPENLLKTLIITIGILLTIPILIVSFHQLQELLPYNLVPDTSSQDAVSKFGI
mgnify:CR=1 FL=1